MQVFAEFEEEFQSADFREGGESVEDGIGPCAVVVDVKTELR